MAADGGGAGVGRHVLVDRVNWWQRLTPLAAAAVLLAAGSVRMAQTGQKDGEALLGAGLTVLGAWLVLEVLDQFRRK